MNHLKIPHLKMFQTPLKNDDWIFFLVSIAIIVLGQQILHQAREETFVEALVDNSEMIKPKWSKTGLTCKSSF